MNNTKFTIGLSQEALTKEINALCAWIDTSNLSSLPPIVNPVQESGSQVEKAIDESLNTISLRLLGYINSFSIKGDILNITISGSGMNDAKRTLFTRTVESFVVCNSIAMLYESQPQASHITQEYAAKCKAAVASIKQLLASAQ